MSKRDYYEILGVARGCTAEDLKTRTKRFAVAVLEFVDTLPHTPAAETVGRQLARAGTGLVGNYRSACRARSHAEFTARMGIVTDESDESELCLKLAAIRASSAA